MSTGISRWPGPRTHTYSGLGSGAALVDVRLEGVLLVRLCASRLHALIAFLRVAEQPLTSLQETHPPHPSRPITHSLRAEGLPTLVGTSGLLLRRMLLRRAAARTLPDVAGRAPGTAGGAGAAAAPAVAGRVLDGGAGGATAVPAASTAAGVAMASEAQREWTWAWQGMATEGGSNVWR